MGDGNQTKSVKREGSRIVLVPVAVRIVPVTVRIVVRITDPKEEAVTKETVVVMMEETVVVMMEETVVVTMKETTVVTMKGEIM